MTHTTTYWGVVVNPTNQAVGSLFCTVSAVPVLPARSLIGNSDPWNAPLAVPLAACTAPSNPASSGW